jgi:ubiquitin C-terminal hydrolase
MNLIKYNKNNELKPTGFHNIGSTCYFNSILQGMISCTSFLDKIISVYESEVNDVNKSDTKNQNPLLELLYQFIKKSKYKNNIDVSRYSSVIWKTMIIYLTNTRGIDVKNFASGQQCAREGFHYLLESLDEFKSIQNLFSHRYQTNIYCPECKEWVSKKECDYSLFEIHPTLFIPQIDKFMHYDKNYKYDNLTMQDYLLKQNSFIDKDFKCPNKKCKLSTEKFSTNILTRAPEILVIMSKKYIINRKINVFTDFPETICFNGYDYTDKKDADKKNKDKSCKMVYKAVAQIEHSGGIDSGHYYTICKRDGGWYILNDNSILETPGFLPTNNTYIVFYHIV